MSGPNSGPSRAGISAGLIAASLIVWSCPAAADGVQYGPPQVLLAQAQPAQPRQNVEANIAELRRKLQITPAQEAQFNAVAGVIRDNARLEASAPQQPSATASAVDELRAAIRYDELELAGLKRMLPALEALYAILSPAQRQTADAVFRQGPGG